MLKTLSITIISALFLSMSAYSQEIERSLPPVYKSVTMEIHKRPDSSYTVMFKNREYEHINDYKFMSFQDRAQFFEFLDMATKVLVEPKPGKDEDLTVEIHGIKLIRYGFDHKYVYYRADGGYGKLHKNGVLMLKNAVNDYKY